MVFVMFLIKYMSKGVRKLTQSVLFMFYAGVSDFFGIRVWQQEKV